MSEKPKKTRDDLVSVELRMSDGTMKKAFNLKDASVYLGVSGRGLEIIRRNLEKEGRSIKTWKRGYGADTYILKEDLDDLMTARPVEE
jgi:hypothetical protein